MFMVISFFAVMTPALVLAQPAQPNFTPLGTPSGLVPCGTETSSTGVVLHPCGWSDFLTLITNITNYLIILGAAVSALAFGWAGFLMMTAGGEMSKIEQGKAIFGKVLVGFLIMLSAWLIVHAINAGLLAQGFFGDSGVQAI